MIFELYEHGKEQIKNEDNLEWIDKVTCWIKREEGYNIYIFQVIVVDENELENLYGTITASIAVEFQSILTKAIEKWNIYLIFECRESIDWKMKQKIEQDKYAVRKVIWDEMSEEEIGTKAYIENNLFFLNFADNLSDKNDTESLLEKIKKRDVDLYEILQKKNFDIKQKTVMYIGDDFNE